MQTDLTCDHLPQSTLSKFPLWVPVILVTQFYFNSKLAQFPYNLFANGLSLSWEKPLLEVFFQEMLSKLTDYTEVVLLKGPSLVNTLPIVVVVSLLIPVIPCNAVYNFTPNCIWSCFLLWLSRICKSYLGNQIVIPLKKGVLLSMSAAYFSMKLIFLSPSFWLLWIPEQAVFMIPLILWPRVKISARWKIPRSLGIAVCSLVFCCLLAVTSLLKVVLSVLILVTLMGMMILRLLIL